MNKSKTAAPSRWYYSEEDLKSLEYLDLPSPLRGRLHEIILEDPISQLNFPPVLDNVTYENFNLSSPSSGAAGAIGALGNINALDPNLQLWREGLVDLLSRNLDGAGPLRAVPPTTVIRRWEGRADRAISAPG